MDAVNEHCPLRGAHGQHYCNGMPQCGQAFPLLHRLRRIESHDFCHAPRGCRTSRSRSLSTSVLSVNLGKSICHIPSGAFPHGGAVNALWNNAWRKDGIIVCGQHAAKDNNLEEHGLEDCQASLVLRTHRTLASRLLPGRGQNQAPTMSSGTACRRRCRTFSVCCTQPRHALLPRTSTPSSSTPWNASTTSPPRHSPTRDRPPLSFRINKLAMRFGPVSLLHRSGQNHSSGTPSQRQRQTQRQRHKTTEKTKEKEKEKDKCFPLWYPSNLVQQCFMGPSCRFARWSWRPLCPRARLRPQGCT